MTTYDMSWDDEYSTIEISPSLLNDIDMVINPLINSSQKFRFVKRRITIPPYENLKNMEKELMSKEKLNRIKIASLSHSDLVIYNEFKMKDFKKKALVNYVNPSNIGNKSLKLTWFKALAKTFDWSFNTFAVSIKSDKKHPLHGQIDILLIIQDFMDLN